jgi:hypothetical protein
MRDYISIGGTAPSEEPCAQVGRYDYEAAAKREGSRFIELIRKCCGREPEGAKLALKSFPHDFGTYYEVVCYFDDDNEKAKNYAFKVEREAPDEWVA